jgi:hypothetical protein
VEGVDQHWRLAPGRPGTPDHWGKRDATLVQEDHPGAPALRPPFDPRPLLGHPVVDHGLVALGRGAAWALQAPAQPLGEDPPHLHGMMAHPGQPPDHLGNALQGPSVVGEPVRPSALQQGLFDLVELDSRQLAVPADRAANTQCLDSASLPGVVPAVRALPGDPDAARDRRRGQALGKQTGGGQPAALQDGLLWAKSWLSESAASCAHAASLSPHPSPSPHNAGLVSMYRR